jgi:Homeodomain-like domain-containing protein
MALRAQCYEKTKSALSDHSHSLGGDQSNSSADRRVGANEDIPRFFDTPLVESASAVDGLADVIGERATEELLTRFGGRRLYVPHLPQQGDQLTSAIGPEAARRLAKIFGGDHVELPNPTPRRILILQLRNAGLSVDAIARHLHCTRRRVYQVLAEARSQSEP